MGKQLCNVEINKIHMKSFCENYGLRNLINQPTCYKNPTSPICIDLFLIDVPRSFQSACALKNMAV